MSANPELVPPVVIVAVVVTVCGVGCVVATRVRLARTRGKVPVQGWIVHVRCSPVTRMVTFDYPVPGGWARASRTWNGSNIGALAINPGKPITVMVDPESPHSTPHFTSLGLDGTMAVALGALAVFFGLTLGGMVTAMFLTA